MGNNETRRTSDKIVESQLDKTGQAKSQASDSKGWTEKVRQNIGPAFAALTMGGLAFQGILAIGGVGGSTSEAPGTALTLRDGKGPMDQRPSFQVASDQRAEIIGKSPTKPYVPAPRPEWLSPPKGPTLQEIWPNLYEQMVKGSEEKGQGSKVSLRGEAQETYDGETSSGQAKPDKHQPRKLLSLNEKKIATVQALQSFIKKLNDKKVRERSLLEKNSGSARLLQEQLSCTGFNYTQLTQTDAQTQLSHLQAVKDATQYLGIQPDWNSTYYAYNDVIVATYPPEEYSITFLAIDNSSAGNDTLGLLGQFVVHGSENVFLTWSTPQGKTFAAIGGADEGRGWCGNEALVSGDINWGKFTFSSACFVDHISGVGYGGTGFDCDACALNLSKYQSDCYCCVLESAGGADTVGGISSAKQCIATNSSDQYACINVSLSGVNPGVQLWPYMMKISGEVYVQNNCAWGLDSVMSYVGFNYVCPPRTCPPGRAYYTTMLYWGSTGTSYSWLNPGECQSLSNFSTWLYCSTFNETEKVNYISLPTSVDMNIMAFGTGSAGVYSPNRNFHVYDASMYPDLNPYPSLPSACGENDPNCTQLCAQHPEANIPSDTIPAQYPEIRPPSPPEAPASPSEAPAHRHKGLSDGVIAGIAIGGIGGGAALIAAAWRCCCPKRKFSGVRPNHFEFQPMSPNPRKPDESSSGVHDPGRIPASLMNPPQEYTILGRIPASLINPPQAGRHYQWS